MKTALYGVMLSALLSAGCVYPGSQFIFGGDDEKISREMEDHEIHKHTPPVRADQVTAENGHQKAQQLEDELEKDREAPLPK